MTNKRAKTPKMNKIRTAKSLGDMLDVLHRARVEAAIERIASIREQITVLLIRSQGGHLSSSDARTLSLHLQQELARTVCNLESWHLHAGNQKAA
jgi:hypothetical protein